MFNIQEWLKSLQPGASGAMIPTGMMGQPMPATPATPATPVAPGTPATPQYAGPADLSLPSAPNLQGEFPPAPGSGGMLAGIGNAIGTNDGSPGGASAFGGLLKFKDDEAKQAAMRGLLGFSAGMLAGGGPSETPTNLGGIVGNSLASGVGAYDGYKENQSNLRFRNAQIAGSEREAAAQAAKAAQAQRDAETRARLFGGQGFDGGSQTGATAVPTPASASMPAATVPTSDLATQINRQRETYQRQYNGLMLMGDGENARPIFQQMNFLDNEAAKQGLVWDGTKYAPAPGILEGARATEAAKTAGRESEARTDDIREYDLYVAQETAAGRQPVSFDAWRVATPSGYQRKQNPDGSIALEPIPGGPEAAKVAAAQAAKDKKADGKDVASTVVDTAFENVIRIRNNATLPVNGWSGSLLSNIGGTAANDMRAALETLKAQASLSTIQKMREESPTGAGMGSPSDAEQRMLQASYATLEQSQSDEEFIRNLNTFRNLWLDMVHGQGNGPERFPLDYGLNPLTTDEQAASDARVSPVGSSPIPRIANVDQFYELAPGTTYIDPQGNTRVKR